MSNKISPTIANASLCVRKAAFRVFPRRAYGNRVDCDTNHGSTGNFRSANDLVKLVLVLRYEEYVQVEDIPLDRHYRFHLGTLASTDLLRR